MSKKRDDPKVTISGAGRVVETTVKGLQEATEAMRQGRFQGTEPTAFPDVERAVEVLVAARNAFANAKDAKDKAALALAQTMRKRGLDVYRDAEEGLEFRLEEIEKLKVTKF